MKKLFLIGFACYLLLNTIGYQVYAHFCGEELQETSLLIKSAPACCPDEKAAEPDDCCTEEQVQFVIEDQYLKTQVEQSFFSPVFVIALSNYSTFFQTGTYHNISTYQNQAFVLKDISPQVLLQIFRI